MQTTSAHNNASSGSTETTPPLVARIADTVSEAALRQLGMDDSHDDFVAWLRSFAP